MLDHYKMLGILEQYNPSWNIEFHEIQKQLLSELGGMPVNIQHVGSTSVPGVLAKPILDIDIIINDRSLLRLISSRLKDLGYEPKGEQGVPGRFAFRQLNEFTPSTTFMKTWQPHHLYVCYADSLALKNHLLFRDALRNDPDLANKYSELKQTILKSPGMSREQYTRKKTDFILSVLALQGIDKAELEIIRSADF